MEEADSINARRLDIWNRYHAAFEEVEQAGKLRRPTVPPDCVHNAHMYYVNLPDLARRTSVIEQLKSRGIQTVFHYIPLHSSPVGKEFGRTPASMEHTDRAGETLLRLPLWLGLEDQLDHVIGELKQVVMQA
jgi:dTDP-4-amino-4,6-dideoxygalactose transaminase